MAEIAVIDLNSNTPGVDNRVAYDESGTPNPTVDLFSNAQVVSAGGGTLDSMAITANGWSADESYSVGAHSGFSVLDDGNGVLTISYTGGGTASDTQWTTLLDSIAYTNTADVSLGSARTFTVSGSDSSTLVFGGTDYLAVTCFCAGTLIATPAGEVKVETLNRGDPVLTSDGQAKPIIWLGRQTVSRVFADPLRVLPIRIKAGALARNVPSRDLLISPDHAILVDGALIQAGALLNGTTIVREMRTKPIFTYYHVELDDHSLILAENTVAETFIDNVDRLGFDNWEEHEAAYPDGKPLVEMPYPRAKAGRQVSGATRARLANRAHTLNSASITAAA